MRNAQTCNILKYKHRFVKRARLHIIVEHCITIISELRPCSTGISVTRASSDATALNSSNKFAFVLVLPA
jgi:hypothetical protein